jgi:uncharacterized protein (TIGR03066 family)
MKLLPLASVACLMLGLTAASWADTKKDADKKASNKDKIIGTWEAISGELPKGTLVEFTKDGKVTITGKIGEKVLTVEAIYEIDGDNLKTSHKEKGKEVKETMKIISLTDKELIAKDDQGKLNKFKKKK